MLEVMEQVAQISTPVELEWVAPLQEGRARFREVFTTSTELCTRAQILAVVVVARLERREDRDLAVAVAPHLLLQSIKISSQ
jgi:hypothetical protein